MEFSLEFRPLVDKASEVVVYLEPTKASQPMYMTRYMMAQVYIRLCDFGYSPSMLNDFNVIAQVPTGDPGVIIREAKDALADLKLPVCFGSRHVEERKMEGTLTASSPRDPSVPTCNS